MSVVALTVVTWLINFHLAMKFSSTEKTDDNNDDFVRE